MVAHAGEGFSKLEMWHVVFYIIAKLPLVILLDIIVECY